MLDDQSTKSNKNMATKAFAGHFLIALFLWGFGVAILFSKGSDFPYIKAEEVTKEKPADKNILPRLGQLGDSFGILNSFFAALAFSGIAFNVYSESQRRKQDQVDRKEEEEQRRKTNTEREKQHDQVIQTLTGAVKVLADESAKSRAKLSSTLTLMVEINSVTHDLMALDRKNLSKSGEPRWEESERKLQKIRQDLLDKIKLEMS